MVFVTDENVTQCFHSFFLEKRVYGGAVFSPEIFAFKWLCMEFTALAAVIVT